MAKSRELTLGQLGNSGYCTEKLSWDGNRLRWGEAVLPMKMGGVDKTPPGVDEVRLLEPLMEEDAWLDGALITVPTRSATPVQYFEPETVRTFVEEPREGEGVWIGITPEGESYMYIPSTTYGVTSKKRGGSVVYGEGWTQCWVNVGRTGLQYSELCLERFGNYDNENLIRELKENDRVEAPMFWGLWRLLKEFG